MLKDQVKIVIAEDDPLLMRLYQQAFELRGYTVEIFFNGEEAYDALLKMPEKPAIVLSDVMMPKMDGLALLQKMKETDALKMIPFVLSTNLADTKYAEKGLALGALAYIVKGEYTPKAFVHKIEELIEARGTP